MSGSLWLNVNGHTARSMGRSNGVTTYTCTRCGATGTSIGHPNYIGRKPCAATTTVTEGGS